MQINKLTSTKVCMYVQEGKTKTLIPEMRHLEVPRESTGSIDWEVGTTSLPY